jgi:hypothetical protein
VFEPLYGEYNAQGEQCDDGCPKSKVACPYTWVVENLKNELGDYSNTDCYDKNLSHVSIWFQVNYIMSVLHDFAIGR